MSPAARPDTDSVRALITALGTLTRAVDDADRIERVRLFEELKSVAAAAQALEARDFDVSQRATQADEGVPPARQGRGVAAQLALARRTSPWAAQRWLGWAAVLTRELPATFAALQAGQISDWRATLIARETIWLTREQRAQVDAELAPHLEGWSDRQVEAEAKQAAYRLDPHGSLARVRGAEKDRRVTLRPAPDTMTRLTALLPVAQGVAAYAALSTTADTTTATGDHRGRGQIMADTLVERLTGQTTATNIPIEIELIMTDRTLLTPTTNTPTNTPGRRSDRSDGSVRSDVPDGSDESDVPVGSDESDRSGMPVGSQEWDVPVRSDGSDGSQEWDGSDEPAVLVGYGPIPAGLARELALGTPSDHNRNSSGEAATRWLRRLFLHPTSGQLAAMDSTRRLFPENQQRFIRLRDQYCRTPWCGAPIRHTDHIQAHTDGGPTTVTNGDGLCAACNYTKQTAHWTATADPHGTITTTTPTGHHYQSRPPNPPGTTNTPPHNPPITWHTHTRTIDLTYHHTKAA